MLLFIILYLLVGKVIFKRLTIKSKIFHIQSQLLNVRKSQVSSSKYNVILLLILKQKLSKNLL